MTSTSYVHTCRVTRTFSRKSFGFVRRLAMLAAAVSLMSFATSMVRASGILYGDFSGATVDYLAVQENSNTGDPLPLFGPPSNIVGPVPAGFPTPPCASCTVTDDSLEFDPSGFNAHASGPAGVDVTDGQLQFKIDAKDGFAINNLQLSEAGDTFLGGFGTNATATSVHASVFVKIFQMDNINIPTISKTLQMTFLPQNTFRLGTDGLGGPAYFNTWAGSLLVDFNSILTGAGKVFDSGATIVQINIDNILMATSELGTQSVIAKKQFGGVSITVNIDQGGGPDTPEPASLVLAGLGFAGVIAARRFRVA